MSSNTQRIQELEQMRDEDFGFLRGLHHLTLGFKADKKKEYINDVKTPLGDPPVKFLKSLPNYQILPDKRIRIWTAGLDIKVKKRIAKLIAGHIDSMATLNYQSPYAGTYPHPTLPVFYVFGYSTGRGNNWGLVDANGVELVPCDYPTMRDVPLNFTEKGQIAMF